MKPLASIGLSMGLAIAIAACGPAWGPDYQRSLASGQRLMHAGRYEDAAASFALAAEQATRVKDRDEALFLRARAFQKAGRFNDARAAYERVIATSPDGPRAGRAMFDIADMLVESGSIDEGYAVMEKATKRFPQHGVTRLALKKLYDHQRDKGGEAGLEAWLSSVAPAFKGTDQEEVIAYERAATARKLGRTKEAHDAHLANAKRWGYPFGGFTTSALWDAAEIDEEEGRYAEAIEHLRALLQPREKADTTGSYERPKYGPAQRKIAEIYRDKLKDRPAARRELKKLYENFPTSRERDDGLYWAARMAKEDGDQREACELMALLAEKLPESRYAGCGRALCPTAKEGKKPCADYILRDLGALPKDEE